MDSPRAGPRICRGKVNVQIDRNSRRFHADRVGEFPDIDASSAYLGRRASAHRAYGRRSGRSWIALVR